MNCSPTIAIALLLMSLTAGMWLLYKTQKENLSAFFKVVAWFVIVSSFCAMICCTLCCALRCCMRHCDRMERCEMGMGGQCGPEGMNKRVMIFKGGEGECEMMEKGCCKEHGMGECKEKCEEGKMDCCKKEGEKCDMKKDSVVVKK